MCRGRDAEKTLLAFVTLDDRSLSPASLRDRLSQSLPYYMIPNRIKIVEHFPLNNSGKIDRRLLLQSAVADPDEAVDEELTAAEASVKEIWLQGLGLKNISKTANFFENGGHSLLIVKLAGEICRRLHVTVNIGELFFNPTIEAHARLVEQRRESSLPGITRSDFSVERKGPLSHQQKRLWFLVQTGQDDGAYNMPFSFELEGHPNLEALDAALQMITESHGSLRTNFIYGDDGLPHQIIRPIEGKVLEITEASSLSEGWGLLQNEAERPFDLEHDRLFRFKLIRIAREKYLFSLVFHHTVFDGNSFANFIHELQEHYTAYSFCDMTKIVKDAAQYADYCDWLERAEVIEHVQASNAYWLDHLNGYQRLKLPYDAMPKTGQAKTGASVSIQLDRSLSDDVENAIRQVQDHTVRVLCYGLSGFPISLLQSG